MAYASFQAYNVYSLCMYLFILRIFSRLVKLNNELKKSEIKKIKKINNIIKLHNEQ